MEGLQQTQTYEKAFQKYVTLFSLTEKDLYRTILDIGSGKGDFVKYLREVLGNKNAYGLENDPYKFEPDSDGIFVGDGLNLSFADDTFELITAKNYFPMFLADNGKIDRAITELIRVLKPGGRIVGDISTVQNEENNKMSFAKQSNTETGEKTLSWFTKRQEGAKHLMQTLEQLKRNGCVVTINESTDNETILTIEKPAKTN